MKLIAIDEAMAQKIYLEHMEKDFPDDELKPFEAISNMMRNNMCVFYALVSEKSNDDTIYAYALCVKRANTVGNDYLIDYLAVNSEYRNQGIGHQFMVDLCGQLEKPTSIICEVENPDAADSDEEKTTRFRRLKFYLETGMYDTGAREILFGVDFMLLDMHLPGYLEKSREETIRVADDIYKMILPPEFYKKFVEFY